MRRVLLLAVLLMPATLPAREFRSEAEMRAFTDQVMELAAAGNLKAALDLVSEAYMVVPRAELEAMTGQALLQAPMVEGRFGKSLGHEFVKEEKAGKSIVRYVQKFEKHPVGWRFVFYKPADHWLVNSFFFSDTMAEQL